MARSDQKLACIELILSTSSPEDLNRIYVFAGSLLKKRSRESALELALSFKRDDS